MFVYFINAIGLIFKSVISNSPEANLCSQYSNSLGSKKNIDINILQITKEVHRDF